MRGLIVGLIMFCLGWGFTEFLAASLQEYRTMAHRPDDGWVLEQVAGNAASSRPDYGVRTRSRRETHLVSVGRPAGAERSVTCGALPLPAGGAC